MATPSVRAARVMRKALTPPEARLWVALKALRGEGFAFRRQAPVGRFFLDFACLGRRLAVEVDGQFHDFPDRMRQDQYRDKLLAERGFLTLRFRADEVRDNLEGVASRIREVAASRPRVWD